MEKWNNFKSNSNDNFVGLLLHEVLLNISYFLNEWLNFLIGQME